MTRAAVWTGVILAMATAAATARVQADNVHQPVPFKTKATVWLDEQGVPQRVEAQEQLPPSIREAIGARIREWRFEPATVNGEAKSGITHVTLDACAAVGASGELNLALGYGYGGPINTQDATGLTPPPRYPVNAVHADVEGKWLVTHEVLPDGSARWISVAPRDGTNPKRLNYFEPALRQWVSQLHYQPEEVDGQAISTVVHIPISFSLNASTKPTRRKEEARSSEECVAAMQADASMRTTSDTPFKLVGDGN